MTFRASQTGTCPHCGVGVRFEPVTLTPCSNYCECEAVEAVEVPDETRGVLPCEPTQRIN